MVFEYLKYPLLHGHNALKPNSPVQQDHPKPCGIPDCYLSAVQQYKYWYCYRRIEAMKHLRSPPSPSPSLYSPPFSRKRMRKISQLLNHRTLLTFGLVFAFYNTTWLPTSRFGLSFVIPSAHPWSLPARCTSRDGRDHEALEHVVFQGKLSLTQRRIALRPPHLIATVLRSGDAELGQGRFCRHQGSPSSSLWSHTTSAGGTRKTAVGKLASSIVDELLDSSPGSEVKKFSGQRDADYVSK